MKNTKSQIKQKAKLEIAQIEEQAKQAKQKDKLEKQKTKQAIEQAEEQAKQKAKLEKQKAKQAIEQVEEQAKQKDKLEKQKAKQSKQEMETNQLNLEYEKMKIEIEKTYFILKHPAKICRVENDTLYMMSLQDASMILKPYHFTKANGKNIFFLDKWLLDENRKLYKNIIFDPHYTGNENYNLFTGFTLEKIRPNKTSIETVLNLLKHVLNDGYDYVLDWIAYIIQKKKKTEKCIILYSDMHGIGKNCIIKLICNLLDSKYCTKIDKINDLEGEFNGKLENKFFCYGDEIKAKSNDLYNTLKNIITQNELCVNKKGIESYKVNDLCNYMFSTNNYAPIKIEKNDRRMDIIHCTEQRLLEKIYTKYNEDIENKDILANIFHMLLNRKIGKLKYESKIKNDIQNQFIPSSIKYLFHNMNKLHDTFITSKTLYENIKNYEKENRYTDCSTVREMGLKIHKIADFSKSKCINGKTHRGYEFIGLKEKLEIYDKELFDELI